MRLIYKAENWEEGLSVVCYYLNPNLIKSGTLTFKEIGDGLYYRDVDFSECGKYIVVVSENDEKKQVQTYDIVAQPGIVTYRGI